MESIQKLSVVLQALAHPVKAARHFQGSAQARRNVETARGELSDLQRAVRNADDDAERMTATRKVHMCLRYISDQAERARRPLPVWL